MMTKSVCGILFFLLFHVPCDASIAENGNSHIFAKKEILHIFSDKSLAGIEYWFDGKIAEGSSKKIYNNIKKIFNRLSDEDRVRFAILFYFSFTWDGEYTQVYRNAFLTERTSSKYDRELINKLMLISDEKYNKYCINKGIDLDAIHGFRCMLDCL